MSFHVATEENKLGARHPEFPLYSWETCVHSFPLLDRSPGQVTLESSLNAAEEWPESVTIG